jgi:post-segregation antitoxin (ccd killing protein)
MTKPTQTNRHRKMVSHTLAPSTIEALRKRSRELGLNQSRLVEQALQEKLGIEETEPVIAPKIRCA